MQSSMNENIKKIETWKRIMLMLVYALIDSLVRLVLWLIIFLQAGSVLLTGNPNPHVLEFGKNLSAYHYHILLFLTFSTDTLPFPFSEWNGVDTQLQVLRTSDATSREN